MCYTYATVGKGEGMVVCVIPADNSCRVRVCVFYVSSMTELTNCVDTLGHPSVDPDSVVEATVVAGVFNSGS